MDLFQGNGYDQAELMVVADYSRKGDEASKLCLDGFYARKLQEYLRDADFDISKVYKTCVIKIYEKGLGVGTWGQDKKIIAALHEMWGLSTDYFTNILLEELKIVRPAVIIAMGEYALRILTGREGITNFRGSVLPLVPKLATYLNPTPKVVSTLHFNIEHLDESQKFLIRSDIGKAVDLVFNPDKPLDAHQIHICRTTNDWLQFRKTATGVPEWLTTDLETHHGFITCASISFDGYHGGVIPMTGARGISEIDAARMAVLLAQDLGNRAIAKNNQNIKYDKRMYERFGYWLEPVKWDTMLAASVIAAEFPKRLGFLTSIYCDGAYHKDEGKEFDPSKHSFDQLYEYCAKDAIKTHQIMLKQHKDLEDIGALEFFQDLMMRWFDIYYAMESTGFLQDTTRQKELAGKYEGLYDLKKMELLALMGRDINLNSPSQIGKYMEDMNFPVLRHRVDSGYMVVNTDAESFKKMRSANPLEYRKCTVPYEHAIRFINLILLLRRIDKVLEYIDVGVHPNGRIYTSVNLAGTSSGRTSGRKTSDRIAIWDYNKKGESGIDYKQLGCSFQTVTKHGFLIEGEDDNDIEEGIIGKDVREIYVPDPGWVIVEVDRSQAEARVVDLLAEDYEGLEEYGKLDKHSKSAAVIFPEYTYEQIRAMYKSGDDNGAYMRQLGKKAVHATNYDMGDFRFSNMANISMKVAHDALIKMHAAKPWIKGVFHTGVEQEVRKSRRLDNPYGRPRMFYKKLDGHGIKVAYSWYPQSTISDGTKLAALKTWDEMDKHRAALVAENHDSITALVKRGYIRKYIQIVTKHLTEPCDFRKGTFYRDYQLVIPCEVAISRTNWGKMNTLGKLHP
jgi:DNA polymerase I-like protein with 3'-5' exonuclease and polymerase domains